MARAIPCFVGGVPTNNTTQVRANGREKRQFPGLSAKGGDLLTIAFGKPALAQLDGVGRILVSFGQAITEHVVGIINVLGNVPPCAPEQFAAADIEQVKPRILFPDEMVAGHHRCQRSEGKTIAAKARGNELAAGTFTDERQAVIGFDYLTE